MNSDTFQSFQGGVGRNALLSQSALGTAETLFTMGTDTGSATAFLQIPTQTSILGSNAPLDPNANAALTADQFGRAGQYRGQARPYFNSGSFDGRAFRARVSGKFTTSAVDAATGHAIKLYTNTTAVLGGASLILSAPSSATLAAGSYNWIIEFTGLWDSVSQRLTGEAWGFVADTYTSRTSVNITGIASITANVFIASVKFNTGAANVITPVEFAIEQA